MEKITWDGLIAALIPLLVFYCTITYQNLKTKRDQRKKRKVIEGTLSLNFSKVLKAIDFQITYLERTRRLIGIHITPRIIAEEPVNRSNEILEEIGYNVIAEGLDLYLDSTKAKEFTIAWEALKVYSKITSSLNSHFGDYVKFYEKMQSNFVKSMNDFSQNLKQILLQYPEQVLYNVSRVTKDYPQSTGTQNLEIIMQTYLMPLKEFLRSDVLKETDRIYLSDRISEIENTYAQLNNYIINLQYLLNNNNTNLIKAQINISNFLTNYFKEWVD